MQILTKAGMKVGKQVAKELAKKSSKKTIKKQAKVKREAERKAKGEKSLKNLKDTRQYAADRKLEKAVTNKKPFTTTSRPSTKDKFKKDGSLRIDNAAKRGMKKGGVVKAHRGDGIAKRGRTRGRIV